MLNYVRQFFKTRFISDTKSVTPNFFCISDISNSLSDCSKNFKQIYRLENFRANVLKKVKNIKLLRSNRESILESPLD